MGDRPGAADFALFGQLTQLAQFDPDSGCHDLGERSWVYAWVSGWKIYRTESAESIGDSAEDNLAIKNLLKEMGRTYVPVMLANHQAVIAGASEVSTTVEGQPAADYLQYQAHCALDPAGIWRSSPNRSHGLMNCLVHRV